MTEIADTPELRERGLMYRNFLGDNRAMLFDFEVERPVSMWMKNTFIPLDMLFIAGNGTIRNIARWATPQSLEAIDSDGAVRAVLEVNGGTADRLGIHAGDRVIHRVFSAE